MWLHLSCDAAINVKIKGTLTTKILKSNESVRHNIRVLRQVMHGVRIVPGTSQLAAKFKNMAHANAFSSTLVEPFCPVMKAGRLSWRISQPLNISSNLRKPRWHRKLHPSVQQTWLTFRTYVDILRFSTSPCHLVIMGHTHAAFARIHAALSL